MIRLGFNHTNHAILPIWSSVVAKEGADISDNSVMRPVAIKILNPVSFRLAPALTLRRCVVAKAGAPLGSPTSEGGPSASGFVGCASAAETGFATVAGGGGGVRGGGLPGGPGGATCAKASRLGPENVWWLVSPNTKQVIAAYIDPRYGNLVELPLTKCIKIWGLNPRTDEPDSYESPNRESRGCAERKDREDNAEAEGAGADAGTGSGGFEVQVDGIGVCIPWLPPKYVQWLAQRRKVKREINNMRKVGGHRNVVELLSVLELVQDSKSTLFLILELVTGGELLDHIRLLGEKRSRAREASALRAEGSTQRYFRQLLSGLVYCHRQGICHRDLSPSNLLLAESPQRDAPLVMKIADFGLSACCCAGNENQDADGARESTRRGLPQRVKSVVGSPHYMAPEVMASSVKGYDGFKADAWSCGVVLYTMLTASLPFDRDLARCPRFKRFKNWANKHSIGAASTSTGVATEMVLPSSTPSSSSPAASTLSSSSAPSASSGPSIATPAPSSPPPPPAWLFPPMIHPSARSLLVSLLVPNPARRISVDQALNHPWLAGGWAGEILGNDGVSIASDASAVAVSPTSTAGKDGSAPPPSAVTSTAVVPKGAVAAPRLVGKDSGHKQPGGGDYDKAVTERDSSSPRQQGDSRGPRRGVRGRDFRGGEARKDRGGQEGTGDFEQGRADGWRGWAGNVPPEELLSCGSLPSTTSYP